MAPILQYAATHMRLEGLALGVAAAWVYHCRPDLWPAIRRTGRVLELPGLAFVASIPWLPLDILNRYAYAGVDLALVAVLVAVADSRPLPLATTRTVCAIALTSYSVYMTQATSIDTYNRFIGAALPGVPQGFHLLGGVALVGLVGGAFYIAVERCTLWLRHRLTPRR